MISLALMLGAVNLGFEEWGEGRAVGWTRGDGGRLTSECEDVSEGGTWVPRSGEGSRSRFTWTSARNGS